MPVNDTKKLMARLTTPYAEGYASRPGAVGTETVLLRMGVEENDRPDFGQTKDAGPHGLHAAKVGKPQVVVGKHGGKMDFGGSSDGLSVAHATVLTPTAGLTMAAHAKPRKLGRPIAYKQQTAKLYAGALDSGLVGWWKFDEAAGDTAADAKGGPNAVRVKSHHHTTERVGTRAARFDGVNDYVSLGAPPAITTGLDPNAMAIAAWVLPAKLEGSNRIIVRYDGAGKGYCLRYSGSTGQWQGWVSDGTSTMSVVFADTPPLHTWVHVAFVWSGDTGKLYLNGALVATQSYPGKTPTLANASGNVYIGSASGLNEFWDGFIDDVRIYGRAPLDAEIDAVHDYGAAGSSRQSLDSHLNNGGLVAWWKFDEASGTTLSQATAATGRGGSYNLTPTGSMKKLGNRSIRFDGWDDYIDVSSPVLRNLVGDKTVSAWVFPTTIKRGAIALCTNGESAPEGGWAFGMDAAGKLYLWQSDGTTISTALTATNVVTANTWQHVAMSYNAQTRVVSFYYNGALVSTHTLTVDAMPGTRDYLGSDGDPSGAMPSEWAFDGWMDEIRAYERALVAAEVDALSDLEYWSPDGVATNTTSNLIAWWKLNNASGVTATDSGKGPAYDGTLTAGGRNFVSNPQFESDLTGWPQSVGAGGTITVVTDARPFGSKCVKFERTTQGTATIQQVMTGIVTPGRHYRVSLYAKGENVTRYTTDGWNTAYCFGRFRRADGTEIGSAFDLGSLGPTNVQNQATTWEWHYKSSAALTAPADAAGFNLYFGLSNCTGTLWVDAVQFEEVGTPGAGADPATPFTDSPWARPTYWFKDDFESYAHGESINGKNGWINYQTSGVVTSTVQQATIGGRTGKFLKVAIDAAGGGGVYKTWASIFAKKLGVAYRVRAKVFVETGSVTMRCESTNTNTAALTARGVWQSVEFTATENDAAFNGAITFYRNASPTTFYIDDVEIIEEESLTRMKYEGAIDLDGVDDRILTPSLPALGTEFSMSAWVRPTRFRADDSPAGMFDLVLGKSGLPYIGFRNKRAVFSWHDGTAQQYVENTVNAVRGDWVHIAATHDGTTGKLYVNGVLVASLAAPITSLTSGAWIIGNFTNATSYNLRGQIADARIYGRALSATDVSSIHRMSYEGLCLYYEGENTSTSFLDSSGRGANSTFYSASHRWVGGKYGNGYHFGGNDEFSATFASNLMKQGHEDKAWSLSAWIKPEHLSQRGESIVLGKLGHHGGLMMAGNVVRFQLRETPDGIVNSTQKSVDYALPSANAWYHVVATYSNRTMKLYVDGVLRGTASLTAGWLIHNYNDTWYMGGGANAAYAFDGVIDDARIFERELNSVDVGALNRLDPTELRAFFEFEETVGETVLDSSGAALSGTFAYGAGVWQEGKHGFAARLGGNEWYEITTAAGTKLRNIAGDETYEMWFKPENEGEGMGLVMHQNYDRRLDYVAKMFRFYVYDVNTAIFAVQTDAVYAAGEWHHVVVTVANRRTLRIFVNGVLAAEGTHTADLRTNATVVLTLGRTTGGGNPTITNNAVGGIDEFRYYDRPLNASEAASRYVEGAVDKYDRKLRADLYINGRWVPVMSGEDVVDPEVEAHYGVTYDGATAKLYKEGEVVASLDMPGGIAGSSDPLLIGHDDAKWFDGTLRDFRYTSSALTAEQMLAIRGEDHPTNNAKLMATFAEGFWLHVQRSIEDMEESSKLSTARGASLDKWGKLVSVVRAEGESDARLRLRIKSKLRALVGGVTVNELIDFTAALLECDPSEIEVYENDHHVAGSVDHGYKAGYVMVHFNVDLILALGFTPADYVPMVALLSDLLSSVAAAGVRIETMPLGGAKYDEDAYDTTGDVYAR